MYKFTIRCALWFLFIVVQPAMAQIGVDDLAVHEDFTGTQTIETVASLPESEFSPRPKGFSAGLTRSVHWLRFTAQAPSGQSGEWLLEMHPSYIDDIRLFESDPRAGNAFIERHTGDQLPFVSRELQYRGFVFRMALKENERRTFYLRLQTTSTSMVMMKLWPAKLFYAALPGEYALLGAVMGLLLIILVINLIYQWRESEAVNLPYTVYIAAVLVNSLFVQGLAAQFLLPMQPAIVNDLQNISSFLMTAAAGWLYQNVLLVQRQQRFFWLAYRTLMILPLILIPAIPLGYFTEAQRVVLAYATLMAPVALWRSVQLLPNKHAGGKMLVVATMISVTAIGASILHIQGFFAGNFVILHAFLIGTVSNVIALHLVIGARSRAQKAVHQQMLIEAKQLTTKVEREMQARNEQAHFISMITHEIKTPLAGVISASEALEILNSTASPEVISRIERIRRNAHRIDGIFGRYLQIDQLDQARLRPRFSEQSLHKVVSMSVQQFTGATHRLRLQLGDDVLLVCDPDLVATAILNLLDNAMKYSPTDEEVILTTRLEGDQCIIEIIDRGPGVSAEMRETIFDRYVRAPEHANIPGTGVGLSLVRSIATTHQGSIEVLDDESGGAKFRLALPLRMTTTMSGIDS
jgi:signal transduction histidine kinase